MKMCLLIGFLATSIMLLTGCGTPGYSMDERFALIGRDISYDGAQAMDDIDTVLMLRPASRLTIWNVQ